ncbi:MAG: hypothetical protein U0Z53_20540 [Blastocatellia bacterium]
MKKSSAFIAVRFIALWCGLFSFNATTQAQHPPSHQPQTSAQKPKPQSSETEPAAETHAHHSHAEHAAMTTLTGGPFRSMNAIGSGTALQPASTPMTGWHFSRGEWLLMLHGELKAGFNQQGGARGVGKAVSQNWLMLMAERNAGRGRLMLRGMVTAEPLTAPHGGFPQLFQTGETYHGRPIIDAQHPHDLVMELAASYTLPLSERVSVQLYGGPVGEPALGPVAFMHRASAMENPAVPLGHHWQDSTHIAHGVMTGSLTISRFRLEASGFHGREPDENRAAIDLGRIDSYSLRIGLVPTPNWALQFSWGRLSNPETLHPGDVVRRTASVMWNRPLPHGNLASTFVWGRISEVHGVSNSYLLESTLNFRRKNYAYFRGELLDKTGLLEDNIFGRPGLICILVKTRLGHSQPQSVITAGEIVNASQPVETLVCQPGNPVLNSVRNNLPAHVIEPSTGGRVYPPNIYNQWFRVGAWTLGGVRDLLANEKLKVGLGADVTFYHQPAALNPIYGRGVKSYQVFLRFRPGEMK